MASAEQRFWAKVQKDCWNWFGAKTDRGYGRFWDGKQYVYAHRWAWEQENGPIPEGLVIDHLCRNRACQNIAHMELVTNTENILRGNSPPANNARKTHCPQGHPYNGDNLYTNPTTKKRHCRECQRNHQQQKRIHV